MSNRPVRMVLGGDKELAATHAGDAKNVMAQLENIRRNNSFIRTLSKQYNDGTIINVTADIGGMDIVKINSFSGGSERVEKDEWVETTEIIHVTIIRVYENWYDDEPIGGYVAENFCGRFGEYVEINKEGKIEYNRGNEFESTKLEELEPGKTNYFDLPCPDYVEEVEDAAEYRYGEDNGINAYSTQIYQKWPTVPESYGPIGLHYGQCPFKHSIYVDGEVYKVLADVEETSGKTYLPFIHDIMTSLKEKDDGNINHIITCNYLDLDNCVPPQDDNTPYRVSGMHCLDIHTDASDDVKTIECFYVDSYGEDYIYNIRQSLIVCDVYYFNGNPVYILGYKAFYGGSADGIIEYVKIYKDSVTKIKFKMVCDIYDASYGEGEPALFPVDETFKFSNDTVYTNSKEEEKEVSFPDEIKEKFGNPYPFKANHDPARSVIIGKLTIKRKFKR